MHQGAGLDGSNKKGSGRFSWTWPCHAHEHVFVRHTWLEVERDSSRQKLHPTNGAIVVPGDRPKLVLPTVPIWHLSSSARFPGR